MLIAATNALNASRINLVDAWSRSRAAKHSSVWREDVTLAVALLNSLLLELPSYLSRARHEVEKVLHALELESIRYYRISLNGAQVILLTDL